MTVPIPGIIRDFENKLVNGKALPGDLCITRIDYDQTNRYQSFDQDCVTVQITGYLLPGKTSHEERVAAEMMDE